LQHRRIAAQDLLLMRLEEIAVVGSAAQECGILEEISEPDVAAPAEESAHHMGIVRVIDTERPLRLPAHGAQAALALEHPVVILRREPVLPVQRAVTIALADPGAKVGIGCISISPCLVYLLSIVQVPSAVVVGFLRASLGVGCISMTLLFVDRLPMGQVPSTLLGVFLRPGFGICEATAPALVDALAVGFFPSAPVGALALAACGFLRIFVGMIGHGLSRGWWRSPRWRAKRAAPAHSRASSDALCAAAQ
jgi:hypothetical protein